MRKSLIIIICCLFLFNTSQSSAQDDHIFQVLTVPSDGTIVWSDPFPSDYYNYCIEVTGTFQYWYPAQPGAIADAGYAETTASGNPGWTNLKNHSLDFLLNDISAAFAGAGFSSKHIYKFNWSGKGTSLKFQIKDGYYGDNNGGLTVTIYKGGDCSQVTSYMDFLDGQPFENGVIEKGQKVNISWWTHWGGSVRISLLKGGGYGDNGWIPYSLIRTITESTANDEGYEWTVPEDLEPGDDYRIYLESHWDEFIEVKSDVFTIKAPSQNYFHEFDVPADGTKMWSRSLKSGKYYRITSWGDYDCHDFIGGADAENASLARYGIYDWVNLKGGLFELLVDERDNRWSTPPNHLSWYENSPNVNVATILRSGHDSPLNFQIYDEYYDENSGELHITIEELSSSEVPDFISILKPQGFHSFKAGEEFKFIWDSNLGGSVQITFDNGYIVKNSTPNDGRYVWTIPHNYPHNGYNQAVIQSLSNGNIVGVSEFFYIDAPDETRVDKFEVPATGQVVKSKVLAPGQKYTIRAQGYYYYWWPENGYAIADAGYMLSHIEQAHVFGWDGPPANFVLRLLVNGEKVKWGDEPQPITHTYEYEFIGKGEPVTFQILDEYYGDNKGELEITIESEENALPVELVTFDYTMLANNKVQLKWITATETNNFGFEIQRRNHNTAFKKIGFVEGHGTTTTPQNYQFTEQKPAKAGDSYRLKQLDTDGAFEFSEVLIISMASPTRFELLQNYPNPFNASTVLKYRLPETAQAKLAIYNLKGQEIMTLVDYRQNQGEHGITWNGHTNQGVSAATGIYFYKLFIDNRVVATRKLAFLK